MNAPEIGLKLGRSIGFYIRKSFKLGRFCFNLSKSGVDEIDRVLAAHYGFTDEELDFIINYDINYRMGRDVEIEDD